MTSPASRALVPLLFFLSGSAALVYQVAWHRLLVVFAGGDVLAITLIVSAFMVGLGCGNLAGGSLADRSSPRRNLMLFGAAEFGIALFGLVSKTLYYDVLYLQFGDASDARLLTAGLLVLGLLLPTSLMGMSLPLLARAMIHTLPEAAVKTGWLYGVNTLGAAAGALGTTWVLMPLHGIEGSLDCAALLNAVCAMAVVPLVWRHRTPAVPGVAPTTQTSVTSDESAWSLRRCLLVFAVSGFIALGLEMVWFRLLGVMLKSTAFTFGTLLAIYLGGVGAGSMVGTLLAPRCRRPGRVFLLLQVCISLYAGLIITLVMTAVNQWPALQEIRTYLDSYEPIDANTAVELLQKGWAGTLLPAEAAYAWVFPVMHGCLPLLIIGPPTFLMGLAFPMLQRAAQRDLTSIGRRIGWIQASNIAGSTLGTVLVGTVLLPMCGTTWTLRILVAMGGALGVLLIRNSSPPGVRVLEVMALPVMGAVIFTIPEHTQLWALAHGTTPERIHLAEDGAGVSVLKKPAPGESTQSPTMVYVNGIGQSWIPYGGVHSALGALPSLMHPKPEKIAIIGLGSGDTLFSAMARPETREITCIEIIGAELTTLRACAKEAPYEGLRMLLNDPRVRHLTGDGRQYLMTTDERFDIIEADALRPTSAHSGNLYSVEYFRLLSSRLRPGGYAVTWTPTARVLATFVKAFPHVLTFPHLVIGSNEPLDFDPGALRLKLTQREVRLHFARAGIDIFALLDPFLSVTTEVQKFDTEFDRSSLTNVNTDVFPKDEVSLPALWPEK